MITPTWFSSKVKEKKFSCKVGSRKVNYLRTRRKSKIAAPLFLPGLWIPTRIIILVVACRTMLSMTLWTQKSRFPSKLWIRNQGQLKLILWLNGHQQQCTPDPHRHCWEMCSFPKNLRKFVCFQCSLICPFRIIWQSKLELGAQIILSDSMCTENHVQESNLGGVESMMETDLQYRMIGRVLTKSTKPLSEKM